MSDYYIAAICTNGHCLSPYKKSLHPDENYCSKCGAKIVAACSECGTPIRGKINSQGFADTAPFKVPNYCHACGAPYPWTQAALDAATAIIEEDEDLSDDESEKLVGSIPDIINETPKSALAAVRVKKALRTAGKFTADALRQFVIDFGCELVRQQLGI